MVVLGLSLLPASQAFAASKSVKTVVRTSLWGTLIGAGVGVLSWPISGNGRAPFVGMSTGLYLGIAFGIAKVSDPDFQRLSKQKANPFPDSPFQFNQPLAIQAQIVQIDF